MTDDKKWVSGLVSLNSAIACPIGAVHTVWKLEAGQEWKAYRYLVVGVDGDWLVTIPDPENPPEDAR